MFFENHEFLHKEKSQGRENTVCYLVFVVDKIT